MSATSSDISAPREGANYREMRNSCPAVNVLFATIRDKATGAVSYIKHADRLMRLIAEEGLAYLAMHHGSKGAEDVETPCGTYRAYRPVDPSSVCGVSIVRSGDILLEGVRRESDS